MSTESVVSYPDNSRKFNINWKTFGLISLVMTSLMITFLWLVAQWNEEQFVSSRQSVHDQYQEQLQRLIETSAESMVQLSRAVSFNKGLMEAISNNQQSTYETELDSLDWNLQADSGVSILGLYDLGWTNLYPYGEEANGEAIRRVVLEEKAHWQIDCQASCRIVTYTPMLYGGEINSVLILAEPLSNVMLAFQRLANIDTGLLGEVNQHASTLVPPWQRSLMALTNPDESRDVVRRAAKDYSLKELSEGIGLIRIENALYELKAMPLQGNQVLVISDVSQDYRLLSQSKGESLQFSAIAFVCAELLLLIFLWRPLRKIKLSEQLEGYAEQQTRLLDARTAALSKAQNLSENLCDSMTAAVLMLDEEGKIRYANRYFAKLVERSSRYFTGKSFCEFVEEDNIHAKRRISEVYHGVLDQYEHVGRVSVGVGKVHRMRWRYVPSYMSAVQEDAEASRERRVIAIGMPLMLPTLESEQDQLKHIDPETGMLNRDAIYQVLAKDLEGGRSSEQQGNSLRIAFLLRFEEIDLSSSSNKQAYLRFNSLLRVKLENSPAMLNVSAARLDVNEIAIICQIEQNTDPDSVLRELLEITDKLGADCRVALGSIASSFAQLSDLKCAPHALVQQ